MAKAFHFNLQKVLNLRQMTEDLEAIRLHHAQATLFSDEKQLEQLTMEKTGVLKTDPTCTNGSLSLNQLQVSMDYVFQLTNKIDDQKLVVDNSLNKVNDCRATLQEASQQKKIVEKLKGKKQFQYRQQLNKKQRKDESEIAIRISQQAKNGDVS